jgi:hypothetical protein
VGQVVKLRNGKKGQVITVLKARDVLKTKTDVEALLLGPQCQARFGEHWLDIYYEADVLFPGKVTLSKVSTMDVVEILDP